jgi:hypothetical protein
VGAGDLDPIESVLPKQPLGEHDALDLVGALVDLGVLPGWSRE